MTYEFPSAFYTISILKINNLCTSWEVFPPFIQTDVYNMLMLPPDLELLLWFRSVKISATSDY